MSLQTILASFARPAFSTLKVPMESLKRLRSETSAPMEECRRALQETAGDHSLAVGWLKKKGLSSADKRAQKETREGVVAAIMSPCRTKAIMVEVNCETDFVAKNSLFLKFVDNLSRKVIEDMATFPQQLNFSPNQSPASLDPSISNYLAMSPSSKLFPEDTQINNLSQQLKILISRLQQNIRIRRIITLHNPQSRYGVYIHRNYVDNIGLQAALVQLQIDPPLQEEDSQQMEIIDEFADDLATQVLGSQPKYLAYSEIPEQEIAEETAKVTEQLKEVLNKAPESSHENIIAGKLNAIYYSKVLLESMPYLLSNEGATVGEVWNEVEKETERTISVVSARVWQCK